MKSSSENFNIFSKKFFNNASFIYFLDQRKDKREEMNQLNGKMSLLTLNRTIYWTLKRCSMIKRTNSLRSDENRRKPSSSNSSPNRRRLFEPIDVKPMLNSSSNIGSELTGRKTFEKSSIIR